MINLIKVDIHLAEALNLGPDITFIGITPGANKESCRSLDLPFQDPVESPSDVALLAWHYRLSEFSGRDQEMKILDDWANANPPAISVKIINGEGGVGKSRLAAEFAAKLNSKGWSAGFLHLGKQEAFPISKSGTLLIIDYPEVNRQEVISILNELAGWGKDKHIRVIFLTRQQPEAWLDVIRGSNAYGIMESYPLTIGSIPPPDMHTLFCTAQEKIAEIKHSNPLPISEEALADWLQHAPENRRALFVVALALYSALYPRDEIVRFTGREVVEALADRELGRLQRLASGQKLDNEYVFAQLQAIANISNGLAIKYIESIIHKPELKFRFPEKMDIETSLERAGLLANRTIPPMQPDIVAAAFTVMILAKQADCAPELVWIAIEPDVKGGIDRIGRLCHDAEVVLGMTENRIGHWLAEAALDRLDRSKILDKYLWIGMLPRGLAEAGAAVYQTLLKFTDDQTERAGFYNNLSNRLGDIGNKQGALEAMQEAMEIYRRLAKSNPPAFEQDLAMSFNNLSNRLSDTGDRQGALEAIREAVEIYRRLAKSNPAAFEPNLAGSLNNLSKHSSYAGDSQGALAAIREAVEIHRGLAESNPATFEPDLARSLNNLSICLSDTRDWAGALEAIREAVQKYRRLAESNPAAFEPDLAMSLNNLSECLKDTANRQGALEAIREAVEIYRRLAKSNPAAFKPALAVSLNNLSNRMGDTGDGEGALEAIREAVEIHRGLAESNPAAFEPDLVVSLNNLSNRLADTGDRQGALEAIQEAVEINRRLAESNPAAFKSALAMSLNNLSSHLGYTGDPYGALKAIHEAVEIRRRLAKSNSAAFEPDLAMGLYNLSVQLRVTGDRQGALKAIHEAVEIRRRLAKSNPAAFEPDLARSLWLLGNLLKDISNNKEAEQIYNEAIALVRPYAEKYPGGDAADILEGLEQALKELPE